MSVAPKKRFSILERDGFMCKYCGGKPPFVQLEVDHIIPRCKGGKDTDDNLITSCSICNIGKGSGIIGNTDDKLWKRKINDCIYKMKCEFYEKWNNSRLGEIDQKTKTLLSLYITNLIKGEDGENYKNYYDYYEYFSLDKKPQDINLWREENKHIWESKFKLGLEFCDQVIRDLYQETKPYIFDILEMEILDDSIWNVEGKYNEKLNYKLTQYWNAEFYIIKKYTLFPSAFEHEIQ